MPKIVRVYIELSLWVIGVLIGIFFLYVPQHRRLESRNQEVKNLISKIGDLGAQSKGIVDVEAEIKNVEEKIEAYNRKFKNQGDMPRVIQSLSELFGVNRLKVMSILPKGVTELSGGASGMQKMTLTVELEGYYTDFGEMLYRIRGEPLAIAIEGFEITRAKTSSDRIGIRMYLSVFLKKA